jgi:hypothetical protein
MSDFIYICCCGCTPWLSGCLWRLSPTANTMVSHFQCLGAVLDRHGDPSQGSEVELRSVEPNKLRADVFLKTEQPLSELQTKCGMNRYEYVFPGSDFRSGKKERSMTRPPDELKSVTCYTISNPSYLCRTNLCEGCSFEHTVRLSLARSDTTSHIITPSKRSCATGFTHPTVKPVLLSIFIYYPSVSRCNPLYPAVSCRIFRILTFPSSLETGYNEKYTPEHGL